MTTRADTLQDVVDWVIEHKRGNAFKAMTDDQITAEIVGAYHAGTMRIDVNNRNEIFGIVLYEPYVFVKQILTTHKHSMKNLILHLHERFPEHNASAHRRGKFKTYNVTKLLRKI